MHLDRLGVNYQRPITQNNVTPIKTNIAVDTCRQINEHGARHARANMNLTQKLHTVAFYSGCLSTRVSTQAYRMFPYSSEETYGMPVRYLTRHTDAYKNCRSAQMKQPAIFARSASGIIVHYFQTSTHMLLYVTTVVAQRNSCNGDILLLQLLPLHVTHICSFPLFPVWQCSLFFNIHMAHTPEP